jgi:hypothetical protein
LVDKGQIGESEESEESEETLGTSPALFVICGGTRELL